MAPIATGTTIVTGDDVSQLYPSNDRALRRAAETAPQRHKEDRNLDRQGHHSGVVGQRELDLARRIVGVAVLAGLAFEAGNRAKRKLGPYDAVGRVRLGQNPPDDVEAARTVIDRDLERVALGRSQCCTDSFERRQRIHGIFAERLGERGLSAGIVRAALGDRAAGSADEVHADTSVLPFAQIVDGQIVRRFRLPVCGEAPLRRRGCAEAREQMRQALCRDDNFVMIAGAAAAELQANIGCRKAGPEGRVEGNDIVGSSLASGYGRQQKRDAERATELPPGSRSVVQHNLRPERSSSLLRSTEFSRRWETAAR